MAPIIFKNSLFLFLLYSLLVVYTTVSTSIPSSPTLCHDHERSALLSFKQSLSLNKSASGDSSAYPKTESWKGREERSSDCCSWSGVECDNNTGYVIGLHLSSSLLYGTLPSNSTIFTLVHLQTLDLYDNDFNHSPIPPRIAHLLSLTSLNLSFSVFSGQIPLELSVLSKLTSLDLSGNYFSGSLRDSIGNQLQSLTFLDLSGNNFSGNLPDSIGNLQSLTVLDLSGNSFSGNLPDSIGNLQSLTKLRLRECSFSGSIPASIGNLTQLTYLSLSSNLFNKRGNLSWLGKLTKLTLLSLAETNLYGNIPLCLANLTQLNVLNLGYNSFVGEIPLWLMNMTHLTKLTLDSNDLTGPIPCSFTQLKNLEFLSLSNNRLSGLVELADTFLSLQKLTYLSLSGNRITLLTNHQINFTVPKFITLLLYSCNLREIPYFLRFQNNLEILNLSGNYIHGTIPYWIWNASDSLQAIFLSWNLLTSTGHNPFAFPSKSLKAIDISDNMLQGNLPVPPPNTVKYFMHNNRLTGDIPSTICNTSLEVLNFSNNSMCGPIPQCLVNSLKSLVALVLQNNNFSGTIPEPYPKECTLNVLDLSQNHLTGGVPKSLSNCKMLQILDLSVNQLEQTFPIWLGTIPRLQVLILHDNKFHGVMGSPRISSEFPMLRIIDLSHNYLTGELPVKYIQIWNAMRISGPADTELYIETQVRYQNQNNTLYLSYPSSITLRNKGVKRNYEEILNIFTSIDLSSNKFTGCIPESFGSLEALQSLDLSNNELTGPIPPSIGNLKQLESLDLSHNKLSGVIPQQLASELNFLAFFNVSYNLLSGHIPRGPQFETFDSNSYMMNAGLCGLPLSKTCETVQTLPADEGDEEEDESDAFRGGYTWVFILAGLGSGLVVGIVIGNIFVDRYRWLIAGVVQNLGGELKNRRRPKRQNIRD